MGWFTDKYTDYVESIADQIGVSDKGETNFTDIGDALESWGIEYSQLDPDGVADLLRASDYASKKKYEIFDDVGGSDNNLLHIYNGERNSLSNFESFIDIADDLGIDGMDFQHDLMGNDKLSSLFSGDRDALSNFESIASQAKDKGWNGSYFSSLIKGFNDNSSFDLSDDEYVDGIIDSISRTNSSKDSIKAFIEDSSSINYSNTNERESSIGANNKGNASSDEDPEERERREAEASEKEKSDDLFNRYLTAYEEDRDSLIKQREYQEDLQERSWEDYEKEQKRRYGLEDQSLDQYNRERDQFISDYKEKNW